PIAENDTVTSDTIVGTPNDDTLTYGEVNRILVNPQELLENDTDPQGEILTLFGVSEAVNGAVSIENDEIIFVPDEGFFNEDSGQFQYTVINESEGTATATVTVFNTPPQVIDGRGGNNTLILNEQVAVDLGQATDQTLADTITVVGFNNVFGSPGNDTLIGNQNPNLLLGNDGNDFLVGVGGNNTLEGGNGDDVIIASSQDIVSGGAGSDTLISEGDGATNTLQGGDGDDVIIARPQDIVSGGEGNDTLIIESDENLFIQMPNDVEVLITGKGDNFMKGSPGQNLLISTGGQNTMEGGGNDGNFFSAGPGADLIIGGVGPDSIVFNGPDEGVDTLVDFAADDLILISADGFGGGLTPGPLSQEQFLLSDLSAIRTRTDEHRFILEPQVNGAILFYDPDGNGPEPQIPLAFLNNPEVSSFFQEDNIVIF
ncbi:MAG: calcium-binding protein, partial [Phormidium sp. GEM2.Bin31]